MTFYNLNRSAITSICLLFVTSVFGAASNKPIEESVISDAGETPAVFTKADSIAIAESKKKISAWDRLHVGGYGEVAMSRNFYSDNYLRYSEPERYRNASSHGRFDLPHVVIY
ncbi:MAG: hypothetical protein K2K92_10015, partial [Duncaniella sp.]|nr:hypothetical protein [Duncaniella sp.]